MIQCLYINPIILMQKFSLRLEILEYLKINLRNHSDGFKVLRLFKTQISAKKSNLLDIS